MIKESVISSIDYWVTQYRIHCCQRKPSTHITLGERGVGWERSSVLPCMRAGKEKKKTTWERACHNAGDRRQTGGQHLPEEQRDVEEAARVERWIMNNAGLGWQRLTDEDMRARSNWLWWVTGRKERMEGEMKGGCGRRERGFRVAHTWI